MPPFGLEGPFPAAAGTSESAVMEEGGTDDTSDDTDSVLFSPNGGNERVHNTKTCVQPSAIAA
tara:strand:- start:12 stop:200 length:189 start_codon:yes stop_codon:yes gene_type:complete